MRFVLFFFIISLVISCESLKKKEARMLQDKANSFFNAVPKNVDSALVYYQKASSLYLRQEHYSDFIDCQINIAECNLAKRQFTTIQKDLLKLLELSPQTRFITHHQRGKIYQYLALCYSYFNDYSEAIIWYEKVLDAHQASKKQENIWRIYHGLGDCHKSNHNYEIALVFYNKAEEFLLNSSVQRKEVYLANIYNSWGGAYKGLNIQQSLEFYRKALSLRKTSNPKNYAGIARICLNISNVFQKKGQLDSAQYYTESAFNHYQKSPRDSPSIGAYNNLALLFQEQKDWVATRAVYDTLLRTLEKYPDKYPNRANVYNNLADAYKQQNLVDSALLYYQKALVANVPDFEKDALEQNPNLAKVLKKSVLMISLAGKAQTLYKQYHKNKANPKPLNLALDTYFLADSLIQKMRQEIINEGDRLKLSQIANQIYQGALDVVWELPQSEKRIQTAHYFIERNHAQLLAQAIRDERAKSIAHIPDSLRKQEKNLKIDRAYYQKKLARSRNPNKARTYRYHLHDANQALQGLVKYLENNYPKYYAYKYAQNTIDIPSIQQGLDSKAITLEYLVNEQHVYILGIRKDQVIFERQAIAQLDDLISTYRSSILIAREDNKAKFIESGRALHKILIEPIQDFIDGQSHLYLVPDGNLRLIPFGALLSDAEYSAQSAYANLPYLFRNYSISYGGSSTLLFSKNLANKGERPKPKPAKDFLAIAPVFDADSNLIAAYSRQALLDPIKKEFSPLHHSIHEVQGIEKLLKKKGREDTKILIRKDASEENLIDYIGDYRYVHIASHSEANRNNRHLCFVALFQPDSLKATQGEVEDGLLYTGEILNLELQADLLVLSSCNTGLGRAIPGEGVLSLLRSFTYAGAENIVYTLWAVEDATTSRLLQKFYEHFLSKGLDYAEALRQAKLSLLKSTPEEALHPELWAGVVLQGR